MSVNRGIPVPRVPGARGRRCPPTRPWRSPPGSRRALPEALATPRVRHAVGLSGPHRVRVTLDLLRTDARAVALALGGNRNTCRLCRTLDRGRGRRQHFLRCPFSSMLFTLSREAADLTLLSWNSQPEETERLRRTEESPWSAAGASARWVHHQEVGPASPGEVLCTRNEKALHSINLSATRQGHRERSARRAGPRSRA